jgi:hypothetical protein
MGNVRYNATLGNGRHIALLGNVHHNAMLVTMLYILDNDLYFS